MRRSRLVYPKSSIMRRRDGRRGGSADTTRRREGWHAQTAAAQVAAQSGRQLAACGTCSEGARRRRRSALAPPSPSLLLPAPPSSLSRQDRGRLPHSRRCHRRRPYGRLSRRRDTVATIAVGSAARPRRNRGAVPAYPCCPGGVQSQAQRERASYGAI